MATASSDHQDDVSHLLSEESCTSAEKGWVFIQKTNEGDEIWRKAQRDLHPIDLVKGYLKFPGIPPEDIVEMLTNLEIRRKWDKKFSVIELIEEEDILSQIVYWRMDMPFGVTDRDIIQNVIKGRDEAQNLTYILYKHATHPSRPVIPGVIRAETIYSGVVVRPFEDNSTSSQVSLLYQTNLKGWIPAWAMNKFGSTAPLEWKKDISKYHREKYNKK